MIIWEPIRDDNETPAYRVTYYLKTLLLKTTNSLSHNSVWGSENWKCLSWLVLAQGFMRLQSSCEPGLQSSKVSPGAKGSASKFTHEVDSRLHFLATSASPEGYLQCGSWFHPGWVIPWRGESVRERTTWKLQYCLRSDIPTFFAIFYWIRSVGGDNHTMWTNARKWGYWDSRGDHWPAFPYDPVVSE